MKAMLRSQPNPEEILSLKRTRGYSEAASLRPARRVRPGYQSGKSIELSLEKGDLFFNIARDLDDDESFEIATSTMVIGIRGTSGYVRESEDGYPVLYLTSGKVMVYVEDPDSGEDDQRKVKAGQKLTVIMTDDGPEIIVEDITE